MNRPTNPFARKLLVAITASALGALVSEAQIYTLSDANAIAHVDVTQNAGGGMTDWSVSGVNQLSKQWFWYRTSSGALQQSIDTISAPNATQGSAQDLTVIYGNGTFDLRIDYFLSGATGGNADISETISIKNKTLSPLTFTFFQFSDFDLAGNPGGDSITIHQNGSGKFDQATQNKLLTQISETIITPPADRTEANYAPNTLASLNTTPGYNLNNVTFAGPGDVTWAYQWDFTIAAGAEQDILKDKILSVNPVPEPSALVLGALGVAALVLRRRAKL